MKKDLRQTDVIPLCYTHMIEYHTHTHISGWDGLKGTSHQPKRPC